MTTTMTLEATETTKTTRKARPFTVRCPHCGEDGLAVRTSSLELYCEQCSEDVSRKDLEQAAREITRLLAWIDLA